MYHEIALSEQPKQHIFIKKTLTGDAAELTAILAGPRPSHDRFDVDYFGQDDGADTDAAFRLMLQLGSGLMIYLYVIGVSQPGSLNYFHTFWLKDCAVAEVEMKEFGPPDLVEGALSIPAVYKRVAILDEAGREKKSFVVDSGRFEAFFQEREQRLQMQWHLYSLKDGKLSSLHWKNTNGWSLEHRGKTRTLQPKERVLFSVKK